MDEFNMRSDVPLAFPVACDDPAFTSCLKSAARTHLLVEEFDRLAGCSLANTGNGPTLEQAIDSACGRYEGDLLLFAVFVHREVYATLPSDFLHKLRLSAESVN